MKRPIKRRTYSNFLKVWQAVQAKGYDPETAADITRNLFDQYEENPEGLPMWSRLELIRNA